MALGILTGQPEFLTIMSDERYRLRGMDPYPEIRTSI